MDILKNYNQVLNNINNISKDAILIVVSKTFLITSAPNCGAVREEREPPKDPTAVRAAPVITTSLSFIFFYLSLSL